MSNEVSNLSARLRRFRTAYGEHRASEGRGIEKVSELLMLPYLATGPFAKQWGVRARTFDRFVRTILKERAKEVASRPVTILDLGAGSGWLCYRVVRAGHRAIAMDIRTDAIDGLAAGKAYHSHLPRRFSRVAASFDGIPLAAASVDIAVFNASLHYTLNLVAVIREACRVVTSGGRIAIECATRCGMSCARSSRGLNGAALRHGLICGRHGCHDCACKPTRDQAQE